MPASEALYILLGYTALYPLLASWPLWPYIGCWSLNIRGLIYFIGPPVPFMFTVYTLSQQIRL